MCDVKRDGSVSLRVYLGCPADRKNPTFLHLFGMEGLLILEGGCMEAKAIKRIANRLNPIEASPIQSQPIPIEACNQSPVCNHNPNPPNGKVPNQSKLPQSSAQSL
jgi:hypothetical protein